MIAPLIGVTSNRAFNKRGTPLFTISETYIQALAGAGACPVIIPLGLPETALQEIRSRLDGILFTGGGDVHPERYGNKPHPLVAEVDEDRDRVEIHLLQEVVQAGQPFLGICRGLQVINVAMGGSLYEDILDQRPGSARHQYSADMPRDYRAHPIQIDETSELARILGSGPVWVNSLHHQGIDRLAPGLKITATAPDGLVEAFELPGYNFGIAVQWHPECLLEHPEMRALFQEFVEAAQRKT